jgi:hypothetical protein
MLCDAYAYAYDTYEAASKDMIRAFMCPIGAQMMIDPVLSLADGILRRVQKLAHVTNSLPGKIF